MPFYFFETFGPAQNTSLQPLAAIPQNIWIPLITSEKSSVDLQKTDQTAVEKYFYFVFVPAFVRVQWPGVVYVLSFRARQASGEVGKLVAAGTTPPAAVTCRKNPTCSSHLQEQPHLQQSPSGTTPPAAVTLRKNPT